MSWAKEMDILDPILAEEPGDAAYIVEVTPCTEACIKASFQSMLNDLEMLAQLAYSPEGVDDHSPPR